MRDFYKVILANSEMLTVYPYISSTYLKIILEDTNATVEKYKPEEAYSTKIYDLRKDFEGNLRQELRIKALESYITFLKKKQFNNKKKLFDNKL